METKRCDALSKGNTWMHFDLIGRNDDDEFVIGEGGVGELQQCVVETG